MKVWIVVASTLGLFCISSLACQPQSVAAAGCKALPGDSVRLQNSPHVPYPGAPHETYDSLPPTSGPHLAWTVAPGVYRDEIPEEIQVHALEHGHVVIQYAPSVPEDQVRALERIARRYPRDVVVAPYRKLTSGIALTAWGRIGRLDRVEDDRIVSFVSVLSGRYNHGWRAGARECAPEDRR